MMSTDNIKTMMLALPVFLIILPTTSTPAVGMSVSYSSLCLDRVGAGALSTVEMKIQA